MPVFQANDPRGSIFPRGGFLDALARSGLGEYIAQGLQRAQAENIRQRERSEDTARGFLEKYLALPADQQAAFAEQIAKLDPQAAELLTGGAFAVKAKKGGKGKPGTLEIDLRDQNAKDAQAARDEGKPAQGAIPLPPPRAATRVEQAGERTAVAQAGTAEAGADIAGTQAQLAKRTLDLNVAAQRDEARQRIRDLYGIQDSEEADLILDGKIRPGRMLGFGAKQEAEAAAQRGLTVDQFRQLGYEAAVLDADVKRAQIGNLNAQAEEATSLIDARIAALNAQADADRARGATSEQDKMRIQQGIANEQAVRGLLQTYIVGGVDPVTKTPIPSMVDRLQDPATAAKLSVAGAADPFHGATTREEVIARVDEIIDTTGFIDENAAKQIRDDFNATISRVIQEALTRTTSAQPLPISGGFNALGGNYGLFGRGLSELPGAVAPYVEPYVRPGAEAVGRGLKRAYGALTNSEEKKPQGSQ